MGRLKGDVTIGATCMKDSLLTWIHSGLTCRDVTDRASEYLDDRLVGLTKGLVGIHLASCAHCRVYMKQIELISAALKGFTALYPSPVSGLCLRQGFAARHDSPM